LGAKNGMIGGPTVRNSALARWNFNQSSSNEKNAPFFPQMRMVNVSRLFMPALFFSLENSSLRGFVTLSHKEREKMLKAQQKERAAKAKEKLQKGKEVQVKEKEKKGKEPEKKQKVSKESIQTEKLKAKEVHKNACLLGSNLEKEKRQAQG